MEYEKSRKTVKSRLQLVVGKKQSLNCGGAKNNAVWQDLASPTYLWCLKLCY